MKSLGRPLLAWFSQTLHLLADPSPVSINISKGMQKIHLEFAPRQRLCGNHSVEPEAERGILHSTCFEKRSIIFQSNNVSHLWKPGTHSNNREGKGWWCISRHRFSKYICVVRVSCFTINMSYCTNHQQMNNAGYSASIIMEETPYWEDCQTFIKKEQKHHQQKQEFTGGKLMQSHIAA